MCDTMNGPNKLGNIDERRVKLYTEYTSPYFRALLRSVRPLFKTVYKEYYDNIDTMLFDAIFTHSDLTVNIDYWLKHGKDIVDLDQLYVPHGDTESDRFLEIDSLISDHVSNFVGYTCTLIEATTPKENVEAIKSCAKRLLYSEGPDWYSKFKEVFKEIRKM